MPEVILLHAEPHRRAAEHLRRAMRRLRPRPVVTLLHRPDPDGRPTIALLGPALEGGPKPDLAGVAVLDGDLVWSGPERRFDAELSTALPEGWAEAMTVEPRWVDLRWLPDAPFPRFDPRLTAAAAQLLAPLVGLTTEQLLRRERRRLRRVRAVLATASAVVLAATLVAAVGARRAMTGRDRAVAQTAAALDQEWAAAAQLQVDEHPDTAFLLARQALAGDPSLPEARAAALQAVQALGGAEVLARPGRRQLTGMAVRDADGLVLTGYADGTLDVLAAGTQPRQLLADPRLRRPTLVAIDGGRFVAAGSDGLLRRIDADLTVHALPTPDGLTTVDAVCWGGDELVIGDAAGTLRGWDIARGRATWTASAGPGPVLAVACGRGNQVAATDNAGAVTLVRDGKVAGRQPNAADGIPVAFAYPGTSLRFLDDGRLAVGGADGGVRLFGTTPFAAVTQPDQEAVMPRSGALVGLDQAGKSLLSVGVDRNVQYWDARTARSLGAAPAWGEPGGLLHVAADGVTFYLASPDGRVVRRHLDTSSAASLGADFGKHTFVTSAERQGNVVALDAVGSPDSYEISLRNASGAQAADRTLTVGAAAQVSDLAADGRTIFVQDKPGILTTWSGGKTADQAVPGNQKLRRLIVDPAGDRLIGVGREDLFAWPLAGAALGAPQVIHVNASGKAGVAFLADKSIVAVTNDDRRVPVRIDLGTGRATAINDELTQVSAVATAGRTMAIAQLDGRVTLIDPDSGAVRGVTDPIPSSITALTFLDGGHTLAAGTSGGNIWLLDVATGTPLVRLSGHSGQIIRMTALADGSLVSSDLYAYSMKWDIGVASLLRRGCDLIGRPFTADEARDFGVPAGINPC